MTPRLSIIVPTLNDAQAMATTLDALADWRVQGAEVIVVEIESTRLNSSHG